MRRFLLFVLVAASVTACTDRQASPTITVYKSPTCGCCNKWITHLQNNGFHVVARDVDDVVPYKQRTGLTPQLASCHTAFIDGYAIEGHVPARDIKRLLDERPAVQGLTVPGMPIGSPGMEQGNRKDPYEVLTFDKTGEAAVFSRY